MKIIYLIEFLWVYLGELTKSNILVAFEALRPQFTMKPGFIKIPVEFHNDDALLLLANLITMTPGTVTIDISDDKKYLYAHGLFVSDPDIACEEIKRILENRVERLFQ
jgi:multicomponent Na+:H+ antiporter subunit E